MNNWKSLWVLGNYMPSWEKFLWTKSWLKFRAARGNDIASNLMIQRTRVPYIKTHINSSPGSELMTAQLSELLTGMRTTLAAARAVLPTTKYSINLLCRLVESQRIYIVAIAEPPIVLS